MAGRVKNFPGGPFTVILATDGTDLYGITCDGEGHLQIDVVSLTGIADLATEATLEALKDRIGALTSPAAGSANYLLDLIGDRLGAVGGGDAGTALAYLLEMMTRLGDETSPAAGTLAKLLTDMEARLDAIQVTRGALTFLGRAGVLASDINWTTVATVSAKGELVGIDFTTDYNTSDILITIDGHQLALIGRDGATALQVSPRRVNELNGETAFWKAGVYDATNDYYSLFLKREIEYDATLLVQVRQQSGVNKNVACRVYYRPVS